MQASPGERKSRSDDPAWVFLAEYSLRELTPGLDPGEVAAGSLYQTIQELGVPPECVENIEMTFTRFAREALAHFKTGRLELPERIRVFCQKKMIEDANSAKNSRLFQAEQAMEHAPRIHPSGTKMSEGWGYYIIERGTRFEGIPCQEPGRVVEIFIYDEANWR